MASSSSMKIIAGIFSLASAKASLTILAPSPMNIWRERGGEGRRKKTEGERLQYYSGECRENMQQ